jgi:hypothetical protein
VMDTYLLGADGKFADPDERGPEQETVPGATPDTKTAATAAPPPPAGQSRPDREPEN